MWLATCEPWFAVRLLPDLKKILSLADFQNRTRYNIDVGHHQNEDALIALSNEKPKLSSFHKKKGGYKMKLRSVVFKIELFVLQLTITFE